MTDVVLAIDIGGTKTAVALVGRAAGPVEAISAPTPALSGPLAIVETVAGLAATLLGAADTAAVLRGVGIATAGVVDVDSGAIVSSTDTIVGWTGTPLAALVREALGARLAPDAPVRVLNDVDAHAVGEYRHGAAAGARNALVVAVGTGVGAGVIVEGRPLRGAHHVAGEIAHVPTPGAEHLRCPCGRMGHLEAIASGRGIHRHYLSLGGDPAQPDARAIVARAAEGDPIAERAIAESASALGVGLAGAMTILDPDLVVVTGGVADTGDLWWQPMYRRVRAEVIDALQDVPVVRGVLGGDAPLRGAAASVWESWEEQS